MMRRSLNAASRELAGVAADSLHGSDSFYLAASLDMVAQSPVVVANTSDGKRRQAQSLPDPDVVTEGMAALGPEQPDSQD